MFNNDNNSFKRVDESHPLDLYIGTDNLSRKTLFLISNVEPSAVTSSQIISVIIGQRKDNKWGISFTLLDNKFEDIFNCFCADIIESSRLITGKDKGTEFIRDRFTKWQLMLSKSRGELLSSSVVKGLIGEMLFLQKYLIPMYGQDAAIKSWIGPDKADQDFVCGNIWYEVKATESGSESVSITSVEQLDMSKSGELVIVYLDKTSSTDVSKITLNGIFHELYNLLENDELKTKLSGILLNLGYFPRPEYDEPAYKLSKIEKYKVDEKFPSVRRADLPDSVINLKYQLSISSIHAYLKEG